MTEVSNVDEQRVALLGTKINEQYTTESALKQLKLDALAKFQQLGFPDRKSEAYKYTQITKVLEKNFEFTGVPVTSSWSKAECQEKFYSVDTANHLVFIDGQFSEAYSLIVSSSESLKIRSLTELSPQEHPEILEHLGKTKSIDQDSFALLNLALFNQGLYIKTEKNSDCQDTFIYNFVSANEASTISYPRILVYAETGSRLKVYEKTFVKGDFNNLSIGILESVVKANAEVRYTKLQHYESTQHAVEGIYATQAKDSRFYTNTFSFKGALIRNNVYINVDGENCEAHMNGLYQLSGKSHVDNNTSVDHLKPNSYSNELYKGILDENSRGIFNGKIYVRPDAQKTNAFQSNNNILLTDTATVNTKPQLEIWADDVKCSHGCTTGQLDAEAIFYLRSRGIEKNQAKALMLNAFANEALTELQNDLIKEEVESIILNKLG